LASAETAAEDRVKNKRRKHADKINLLITDPLKVARPYP